MNAHLASISRALANQGYFRRSTSRWSEHVAHKEWLHFAIHGHGVDALINFSLVDDVGPNARRGAERARIVCLVRERRWTGDIDHFTREEVRVQGGELGVHFAHNHAVLRDGKLEIAVRMRRRNIVAELSIEPLAIPSQLNNIEIDTDCPPINWLVVPRARADGWLEIEGRRHVFDRAPAYHDHNWGHFRWGKDFAWEWGYAASGAEADPWTMVYVRLSDRAHLTDLVRTILLWRGERQHRVFRAGELATWHEGLLRSRDVFKLPRVMGLACPGDVTDVPRSLFVRARRGDDWVDFVFETEEAAQVVIPNDDDMGVTIINEVSGRVCVEGSASGERIHIEAPSIFEFLSE
jgi:hypothetical protein